MKKIGLALILMQFLIAAGCTPATTETAAPLPSPTAMPTQTMTPTATARPLTADDFLIVDGNIQEKVDGEWRDVPIPAEFAGEIAYVESHEGNIYGIDIADRAEVVRNDNGEWVKYERPIIGADFDGWNYTIHYNSGDAKAIYTFNEISLDDLDLSLIFRLPDSDGTLIPWGYQTGSYSWKNSGLPESSPPLNSETALTAKFSGYFLGKSTGYLTGTTVSGAEIPPTPISFMVFEIPYKYDRQIFFVNVDSSSSFLTVNYVDNSGRTINSEPLTISQISNFLNSNMEYYKGRQVVLTFMIPKHKDYTQRDMDASLADEFWSNALIGTASDVPFMFMLVNEVTIPDMIPSN